MAHSRPRPPSVVDDFDGIHAEIKRLREQKARDEGTVAEVQDPRHMFDAIAPGIFDC